MNRLSMHQLLAATLLACAALAGAHRANDPRHRRRGARQERLQRGRHDRAPEGRHRSQGHPLLRRDRPGQARGQRRRAGLRRSTLLEFGNPPLGTQFITARAEAGLDWPVRLLVTQDERGDVWAVYTDFAWIAQRHGITNRAMQFQTASGVVASITSAVSSPR